jgi:ribosome-associated protein
MIKVTETIFIEESELKEKFLPSSGPGGQNVNKVATAVQLRFNVSASPNLPPEIKYRALDLAGSRRTLEGEILIEAERFRTRGQNRADALERLLTLLREATQKPKPRRKTKPTRASKKRRVDSKKSRGNLKRTRSKVNTEE